MSIRCLLGFHDFDEVNRENHYGNVWITEECDRCDEVRET